MNGPGLGWLTWLAMGLVLAAAAVLSFDALRDLAELCGVDPLLAPLLPVAVDAGAAVSTRVWLDGRAVAAERYARRMTLALLFATVAGNALHGGLIAAGIRPAWWVAVAVTAIPPAVVGATVHLAVLVGRPVDRTGDRTTPDPASASGDLLGSQDHAQLSEGYTLAGTPAPGTSPVQVGQVVGSDHLADVAGEGVAGSSSLTLPDAENRGAGADGSTTNDRSSPGGSPAVDHPDDLGSAEVDNAAVLARLVAEGAGRRRAAKALGTTPYRAGQLLAGARNGHRSSEGWES